MNKLTSFTLIKFKQLFVWFQLKTKSFLIKNKIYLQFFLFFFYNFSFHFLFKVLVHPIYTEIFFFVILINFLFDILLFLEYIYL
jgi:hypothetical protein